MTRNNPARGILVALALYSILWFMIACAVFSNRWAVPHAPTLRPCVGTYVYPDSASVCNAPKEER